MKSLFLLILFPMLLSGCLGLSPASRTTHAGDIAAKSGLVRTDITAPPFVLAQWARFTDPTKPTHLYIEGDGAAWLSRREPSLNPTPSDPVALRLAAADGSPNVVYIARPCQFVPLKTPRNDCSVRDWTSDRFSPRVMGAYQAALDQISRQYKNNITPSVHASASQSTSPFQGEEKHGFHIIGYSGGGYIALMMAGTRPDVISVRTVAGNIDNNAFTTFHRVSPMPHTAPLSPYFQILSRVPQRHFIGEQDPQVPRDIAAAYRASLPSDRCITIDQIPSIDHHRGWVQQWPSLLDQSVGCEK